MWDEAIGVDTSLREEIFKVVDGPTEIFFTKVISDSVGPEPNVGPWAQVRGSVELDIRHIPRPASWHDNSLLVCHVLVLDGRCI